MLLESVNVTSKRVEDLLEKINLSDSPVHIEDHLTGNLIDDIYRIFYELNYLISSMSCWHLKNKRLHSS